MIYRSEFKELEFWQKWNECKHIFEGMEKALERAKKNNPNADYLEAENKLKIMEGIQGYLGGLYERLTVITEVNLQHGEKYAHIKNLYLNEVKENARLKKELENIKQNLKL